jgi:hypothetical protein
MIPTFKLRQFSGKSSLQDKETVFECIDYPISCDVLQNIVTAIEWADENGVNLICLALQEPTPLSISLAEIESIIANLINDGIYAFFTGNEDKNHIPIAQFLIELESINKIGSFIISSPIYKFILLLVNRIKINNEKRALKYLLNIIAPYHFSITDHSFHIPKESRIHIICPFRNASKYIKDCLDSIERQNYKNYHIHFIDDASDDGSLDMLPDKHYISKYRNNHRKNCLYNIHNTLMSNEFKPEDIICILDGDDMLNTRYALSILNNTFLQKGYLLTYGTFCLYKEYTKQGKKYTTKELKHIRTSPWKATPLRAFKFKLYKKFLGRDKDLMTFRRHNGLFFDMSADMAIMFSLIEIAGHEKVGFIPSPLYAYRLHENNDHVSNRKMQLDGELELRAKPPLALE